MVKELISHFPKMHTPAIPLFQWGLGDIKIMGVHFNHLIVSLSQNNETIKIRNYTVFFTLAISYGQTTSLSHTKILEVSQVKEIAKANAQRDFSMKILSFSPKSNWRNNSFLLGVLSVGAAAYTSPIVIFGAVSPLPLSFLLKVELPDESKIELNAISSDDHKVYVKVYHNEIKKLRCSYSLMGGMAGVALPLGYMILGTGFPVGN